MASFTMKFSTCSAMVHGGGKRRAVGMGDGSTEMNTPARHVEATSCNAKRSFVVTPRRVNIACAWVLALGAQGRRQQRGETKDALPPAKPGAMPLPNHSTAL